MAAQGALQDVVPGANFFMINKIVNSLAEALSDVKDGSTVLIGGFGSASRTS